MRMVVVIVLALAHRSMAGEATFTAVAQDRPTRVVVKVNGHQIFPASTATRVPVAIHAVDRVEITSRPEAKAVPSSAWVFFAQFVAGEAYRVRENPCSLAEIWPSDGPDPDAPRWVRFRVAPGVRQAIEFRKAGSSPVLVRPGETSQPIEVDPGGAMCPHTVALTVAALPAPGNWATAQPQHLEYRFLNDRVLVVTYAGPKAGLTLALQD